MNCQSINLIYDFIYIVPAALIAIMMHELAHGYVSYILGDPTPKRQGRLSLNPAKHLDVVGTICLILFRVGWAKPVVINPDYYKNKRLGMFLVALAGPLINFILAFVSIIVVALIWKYVVNYTIVINIILNFLINLAIINIGLGVFNLIPIPPLDGSKILGSFLKGKAYDIYMQIQEYGFIILFVILALSSMRSGGVSIISEAVYQIFYFFVELIGKMFGLATSLF